MFWVVATIIVNVVSLLQQLRASNKDWFRVTLIMLNIILLVVTMLRIEGSF